MTTILLAVVLILLVVAFMLGLAQYRATGGTPVWAVEAVNDEHVLVRRNVTAPDEETVATLLRHQRLRIEQIHLIPVWRRMLRRDLHLSDFRKKVPSRQVSDMAQTIASFLASGTAIQEAIGIYARQKPDNMCRETMRRLQAELSGGRLEVREAFGHYEDQLGPEVVAIIGAGMSGDQGLTGAFQQIAEMAEKRDNISRQWRKAMVYPCIVLFITIIALGYMLWKVVPSFQSAYASFGAKLPAPTKLTIEISHALFSHLYVPVILILGVIFLIWWLRSNEQTRLRWDRVACKLPILGKVIQGSALGRSMATLSGLLAVGVPVQEALRVATPAAGNKWIEYVLNQVATELGQSDIQEAVKAHADVLPQSLVSFVETGAATADLDTVLRRYAKFAQRDSDLAMENLSTVVEPVMLIIVGAVVGAIVISMYLPMINIVKVIH